MDQNEHEAWNATHYPGTRQMCCECDEPTGRCAEDELCLGDTGPFCETCYEEKRPMHIAGWICGNVITSIHTDEVGSEILEWLVRTGREKGFHFLQEQYEKLGGEISHVRFTEAESAFLMSPEAQEND